MKLPKRVIFVFVILALVTMACEGTTNVSTQPAQQEQPQAPLTQPEVSTDAPEPETPAPDGTVPATITVEPQPVPVPPPSNVELYGFIAQAFGVWVMQNGFTTVEAAQGAIEAFGSMKLAIGDREYPIKETLQSFSAEDWKVIHETGDLIQLSVQNEVASVQGYIGNPNEGGINPDFVSDGSSAAAVAAAAIYVGRCRTTCLEVFQELWYAAAHLATGANWIRIDEGYMSNHPEPYLCGHKVNWERLVDILENCPGYSVSYQGSSILIRKLSKKSVNNYDFQLSPEVAPVALIVAGVAVTAAVVGIVVISGGTATPALALVLLIP